MAAGSSRGRSSGKRPSTRHSVSSRARASRSRSGSRSPAQRTRASGRTSRAPRTDRRSKLDAIAMLMQDHRQVEKLFEQFERAKHASQKQRLFRSLRAELELHTRLEEEVLYPEVERRRELAAEVKEAHGEHDTVKRMLREADGLDPGSGAFDATVAGIQGSVEHHVDEEEGQMFPAVRDRFSEGQLQELGQRMSVLKATARRDSGESRSRVRRLTSR